MQIIGEGYTIDCNYLLRVKDYMKKYPAPRRRLHDCDGSKLPIILIEVPL